SLVPGPTRIKSAATAYTPTDDCLVAQRVKVQGAVPCTPCSFNTSALRETKTRTPADTLVGTPLAPIVSFNAAIARTIAPAATKISEVSGVEKLQAQAHRLFHPTIPKPIRTVNQTELLTRTGRLEGRSSSMRTSPEFPTTPNAPAQSTSDSAPSVATSSHERSSASTSTSTSTSGSESPIPSGPAVWDRERFPEAGVKEVLQELKDTGKTSGTGIPALASPEPEVFTTQGSRPVPSFAPLVKPTPVVPAKRRLRSGANKAIRPTKRRRISHPEDDQILLSSNWSGAISPSTVNTPLKCSRINTPITTPTSTTGLTPSLTSPSTASISTLISEFPTALTGPTFEQEENSPEIDVNQVGRMHEPKCPQISCKFVSDITRPAAEVSHPTPSSTPESLQPKSPLLPRRIVPAKRPAPVKFDQVSQTKRRRIAQVETSEPQISLPSCDVAKLETLPLLLNHQETTCPPTASTINDPSPPVPFSGNQPTNLDSPILASDLIARLNELTRGSTKRARVPSFASDGLNDSSTSALGQAIDT
ncbi:hypothetical protein FRC11_001307, partial [Ceratobasidium sp. 423]